MSRKVQVTDVCVKEVKSRDVDEVGPKEHVCACVCVSSPSSHLTLLLLLSLAKEVQ